MGYSIIFDISKISHRLLRSEKNLDFALGYAKLYFGLDTERGQGSEVLTIDILENNTLLFIDRILAITSNALYRKIHGGGTW